MQSNCFFAEIFKKLENEISSPKLKSKNSSISETKKRYICGFVIFIFAFSKARWPITLSTPHSLFEEIGPPDEGIFLERTVSICFQ